MATATFTVGERQWAEVPPRITFHSITSGNGVTYTLAEQLGVGGGGTIYAIKEDATKILKLARGLSPEDLETCKKEDVMHRAFMKLEPPVCPKVYDSGEIAYVAEKLPKTAFFIVMQRCEGDAFQLLKNNREIDALVLRMYEQVATILKKLQAYQFNHRDLKPENVLYVGGKENPTFLLTDFGFSCATIDGTEYKTIIPPVYLKDSICVNNSRDLMQLVANTVRMFSTETNVYKFNRKLLEFQHKGKLCQFWSEKDTCGFGKKGWEKNERHNIFRFLNDPTLNNPNTTPEGLLSALQQFKANPEKVLQEGLASTAPAAAGQGTLGGRRKKTQRKKRRRSTRRNR